MNEEMNEKTKDLGRTDGSADKKKLDLFYSQKELLDTFLEHQAITQAQYEKSLNGLIEKMGIFIREGSE